MQIRVYHLCQLLRQVLVGSTHTKKESILTCGNKVSRKQRKKKVLLQFLSFFTYAQLIVCLSCGSIFSEASKTQFLWIKMVDILCLLKKLHNLYLESAPSSL